MENQRINQLGCRIYFNEFEDYIIISNPRNFLPEKVERVLQPAYNPPYHRNPLLAETMVKFKEISLNSILVSGGQTTVANLFYNMGRRTMGLVGLWDVVAFDEVAGINFKDTHRTT